MICARATVLDLGSVDFPDALVRKPSAALVIHGREGPEQVPQLYS
jgi:hypothetical protein